jgi:hypothetical protein
VRIFGGDYPQWLSGAGFEVKIEGFAAERGAAFATLHGLDPAEEVYRCVRPQGS